MLRTATFCYFTDSFLQTIFAPVLGVSQLDKYDKSVIPGDE